MLTALLVATLAAGPLEDQLWEAARRGDAAAVRDLLARGVDVNAKFRYGATALSYAADRGHVEIVKALLGKGADVNVKDTFYGATPLSWAASKGHLAIVEILLAHGATGAGDALSQAADAGQLEMVQLLVAKGRPDAEALSTALAMATREGHEEVAAALRVAGAVPPPAADHVIPPDVLAAYAGTYRAESGDELVFAVKDGRLQGGPPGRDPWALGAFDDTRFRPVEVEGVTFTFTRVDGRVTGVRLKAPGVEREYRRVP